MSAAGQFSIAPVDRASLDAFLATCCRVSPAGRVAVDKLYRAYAGWCAGAGHAPLTMIRFARAMLDRGYRTQRGPSFAFVVGLTMSAEFERA